MVATLLSQEVDLVPWPLKQPPQIYESVKFFLYTVLKYECELKHSSVVHQSQHGMISAACSPILWWGGGFIYWPSSCLGPHSGTISILSPWMFGAAVKSTKISIIHEFRSFVMIMTYLAFCYRIILQDGWHMAELNYERSCSAHISPNVFGFICPFLQL